MRPRMRWRDQVNGPEDANRDVDVNVPDVLNLSARLGE
jgi:hypothetical protein